jgi:hypothetical protein
MTWSLKLHNGDLVIGGSGLDVAANEIKMVQDLRCQLLEKMGHDINHPEYGCLIDGGVGPDGTVYESIIADDDWEMAKLRVQSEIVRVVGEYQRRQLDRARLDKAQYGKQTLTPKEIIANISGITFTDSLDKLIVQVHLQTMSGDIESIDLNLNK